MYVPETASRVPAHTAPHVNLRIQRSMEERLEYYARHREEIPLRLKELDREWDIERTLEANAASVSLAGLALGIVLDRKWLLLPLMAGGFLLQHAVQGWCPPLPVLRRLGVRTAHEIQLERNSLKVLLGDYDDTTHRSSAREAVAAVRA